MNIALRPLAALAAAAVLIGCEHSDSDAATHWNYSAPTTTTTRPAAVTVTTPPSSSGSSSSASAGSPSASASADSSASDTDSATPDAVPFGALRWVYGGRPSGSGARSDGVVISGARFSSNGVSFTYNKDLSAWGYPYSEVGGVACLFVQKSNGQWVGGKFDWISSSRRSRDFANVYSGYNGWSLADVPNPCAAAFVIISTDGKRRSNVLAGTWAR